jgi:hypothetical protein
MARKPLPNKAIFLSFNFLIILFLSSSCTPPAELEESLQLDKTLAVQNTQMAELSTQIADLNETISSQWDLLSYLSTQMPFALDLVTPTPEGFIPTPTAWIGPEYSLDTRTGVAEVDAVIEAFLNRPLEYRVELAQYYTLPCTEEDGMGDVPRCQEGEVPGTQVDFFPVLYTEGILVRRESITSILDFTVEGLYAVYAVPEAGYSAPDWPVGEYAVLFTSQTPEVLLLVAVHVADGSVVRLEFLSPYPPVGVSWPDESDFLLPPLAGWNPTPMPMCTPPACGPDEVYHCPETCPGGCGTTCATPTPTQ